MSCEGLLVGGLYQTVRDSILNFMDLIATYGFVPNGGRLVRVFPIGLVRRQTGTDSSLSAPWHPFATSCTSPVLSQSVTTTRISAPAGAIHRVHK